MFFDVSESKFVFADSVSESPENDLVTSAYANVHMNDLTANAAAFGSTLQASGMLTALAGATVSGSAGLRVAQAAYIGGASTLAGLVTAQAGAIVSGSAGLAVSGPAYVGGAAVLNDALTVVGLATAQAGAVISGSAGLAVAGAAYIGGASTLHGAATLDNTLTVAGLVTAQAGEVVSGSAGLSVAQGAYIGGAATLHGAATLDSTLSVTGLATAKAGAVISGSAGLAVSNNAYVGGDINAANIYANSGVISAATLKADQTGSLVVAAGAVANNEVDIANALRLIDAAIVDAPTRAQIHSAYQAVRIVTTGSFDVDGAATVNLTALKAGFDTASLNYISLDVMTKSGSGDWTNDLVAVHLHTSGSSAVADVTALAEATDYRIIAVNEKDGKFAIPTN
jgi:cytoskeletal protein CcmA (bactofilin family)